MVSWEYDGEGVVGVGPTWKEESGLRMGGRGVGGRPSCSDAIAYLCLVPG